MSAKRPGPGAVIEVGYPFVLIAREDKANPNPEADQSKWRPGTRDQHVYPDSAEIVADGMGTMILTIVSTHVPPGWPERVFFTRIWRDPDGHEFGRRKLHTRTRAHFSYLCRGYRHRFDLADEAPALEHVA